MIYRIVVVAIFIAAMVGLGHFWMKVIDGMRLEVVEILSATALGISWGASFVILVGRRR